jgi:hypothetical protein
MFAVKNSTNRRPAFSPAAMTTAGTPAAPPAIKSASLFETSSLLMFVYDNVLYHILYRGNVPLVRTCHFANYVA